MCYCPSRKINPGVFIANSVIEIKNERALISSVNTTDKNVLSYYPAIYIEWLQPYNIFHMSNWSNPVENRLKNLANVLNLNNLNSEERESIISICRNYNYMFYLQGDILEIANIKHHEITVKPNICPIHLKPYSSHHATKTKINNQIKKLLTNNIIFITLRNLMAK